MPEKIPIEETLPSGLTFRMIFVEGGEFRLGGPDGPETRISSFFLSEYPVTQDVWEEVMGNNPSRFLGKRRPVEQVSWEDAQQFIQKLNKRSKGGGYRLPTEAEWEYAARGGKDPEKRPRFEYAGGEKLDELGWYSDNSHGETKPVGLKLPNELGLYDMSGNVWEWCEDWYEKYPAGPLVDPRGPEQGTYRVYRGGSWSYSAESCRTALRNDWLPQYRFNDLGFRLALSYPPV